MGCVMIVSLALSPTLQLSSRNELMYCHSLRDFACPAVSRWPRLSVIAHNPANKYEISLGYQVLVKIGRMAPVPAVRAIWPGLNFKIFARGPLFKLGKSVAVAAEAAAVLPRATALIRLKSSIADLQAENEQLKNALRQSEERFFKIFHASSNPMAITTCKEGRIVDLNEANARFGGFACEELIGHTIAELNLWADPKQEDALRRRLREEGKVHNAEACVRTKAGDIRTILLSLDQITVDDEPCELGTTIDITERKRESDALRQSEEKYRTPVCRDPLLSTFGCAVS